VDEKRPVLPEQCWIRLSEPCRLCVPGATGPLDCGLVYLVMTDPDLSAALARMRAEASPERAPQVSVR